MPAAEKKWDPWEKGIAAILLDAVGVWGGVFGVLRKGERSGLLLRRLPLCYIC